VATKYVVPDRFPQDAPAPLSPTLARRVNLLRAATLFQGLSLDQLIAAAKSARARIYRPDQLLFAQDQPADHLLLVDHGSVKLTQHGAHGSEVILNLCGAHDALGVSVLLERINYRSSARVMSRCKALVWNKSALEGLLTAIPQLRNNVDNILLERLSELQDRFLDISTESVERRVAFALLRLLRHVGQPSPSGVEIALSRDELAQLTGTNPFAVSRVVSKWKAQGMIQARPQAVLVLDPKRLFTTCLA